MKTIHVVQLGISNRQWNVWVDALVEAGYDLKSVDPLSMELLTCHTCPGDTVLFSGLLPNLSRYIQRISARSPNVNIMVACENDSFAVRYEVMLHNEAFYVSGPMEPERFVETVRSVVLRQPLSDAV